MTDMTDIRHDAQRFAAAAESLAATTRTTTPTTTPQRRGPSPHELLDVVRQVHDYAAEMAAKQAARNRIAAARELARDCERLARKIDDARLTGAGSMRDAAQKFADIAQSLETGLRRR